MPNTLEKKDNRFIEIIRSKEPNIQKLILAGRKEETQILIFEACRQFLDLNSPAENNKELAVQFAEDIIETRPDWKIEDIKYLFKFIRQRQDIPELKLFGNKITGIRLMEMVVTYENYKSEGRERVVAETKINDSFVNQKAENKNLQKYLDKLKTTVESLSNKVVYTGKPPIIDNALNPVTSPDHFTQLTALIPEFNEEEKKSWKEQIEKLNPSTESEVNRMTQLLELLK